MKIHFYVKFSTQVGQSLWLCGDTVLLGNRNTADALPMNYFSKEQWSITIDTTDTKLPRKICYKYFLKNEAGEMIGEWGNDRIIDLSKKELEALTSIDTWNHSREYENTFFTLPFKEVLLPQPKSKARQQKQDNCSHTFKVKAPLLQKHEVVCLIGNAAAMGNWYTTDPLLLTKDGDWWITKITLTNTDMPCQYKYGVYNKEEKQFVHFENGDNRILQQSGDANHCTILHDGFIQLPNNTWKAAGVSIPVFSLRSKKSFGVGEFTDIKLLVDWAKHAGLKLIQLLPINDTIANHSWKDSYPYAAISAFALHPIYIDLEKVAGGKHKVLVEQFKKKQKQLNSLPVVDYEEVIKIKTTVLKELYALCGQAILDSAAYHQFFEKNKHWLLPYAAFCFYRDKFGTSRFEDWKVNNVYNKEAIEKAFNAQTIAAREMKQFCFIQFHLHLQLKEAADYAHKKGIILKGDIPIGVYRDGCDAWTAPELYNMHQQVGAPPDDFTAIGQNWGFPTYNWQKMQDDDFRWWKQRFEQMSEYFGAFRIDHILGFFRIWSIPAHAVQGVLGKFEPCLPVHINEFAKKGIAFDHRRFCKPFITDEIIEQTFGAALAEEIKKNYLNETDSDSYTIKPAFETQRQIENHFETVESTTENEKLKQGLYQLLSNIILLPDEQAATTKFHFRISVDQTSSFQHLAYDQQEKLKALYIDYFFHRQDDFWKKEAMQKLPKLKATTNMLVCGEDLGMVPHCVPDVMKQLGILSLEIQRMPKNSMKEFFYPQDAPYLSVITPSTHDMSTIRAWWEENRSITQRFYNNVLDQWSEAPTYCEAWINRAIVLQHLYSPAMWSIFQMQDLLGMSETLRREKPQDERINNPANPDNYWQYRMHINLETLIKEKAFTKELNEYIKNAGR